MEITIKLMAVCFIFIAVFGDAGNKPHSVIMSIACLALILFPLPPASSAAEFVEKREVYIIFDGGLALLITMFLKHDKTAYKHVLLLSFATLCHIMLIFSIQTAQSGFFHSHYKELIIMVGLLQMMVSYDGFIGALSRVQGLLLRTYHYFNRYYQSLFAYKDGGKRT